MTLDEIEQRLKKVLDAAGGQLPPGQLQSMQRLVAAGEPGIALENYLTQLYEYDVAVTEEILREVRTLGESMGINKEYWEVLSPRPGAQ